MNKKDYHSEPFKTLVVLGESHVAGGCATTVERRWVNVLADTISRWQAEPVTLINSGIGANAISKRSPGYETSAKPSALERYRQDVIAHNPDLFILSYGLNDMRAAMPFEDFKEDMEQIIVDVKEACSPVIALTTVYYMTAYDWYPPYDKGSIEATEIFNLAIRQLAEKHDCILIDIWDAEGQADWLIHPDTVHAHDLGHFIIGNRAFETIANHCSGIAKQVNDNLEEAREEVARTMDRRMSIQCYDH